MERDSIILFELVFARGVKLQFDGDLFLFFDGAMFGLDHDEIEEALTLDAIIEIEVAAVVNRDDLGFALVYVNIAEIHALHFSRVQKAGMVVIKHTVVENITDTLHV